MSFFKPKPVSSQWPISRGENFKRSQLKHKVSICNRRQARENVRDQVTNSLSFASDWLRGFHECSSQSKSVVQKKPIEAQSEYF